MTVDDWERTGEILGICKSEREQVKHLSKGNNHAETLHMQQSTHYHHGKI